MDAREAARIAADAAEELQSAVFEGLDLVVLAGNEPDVRRIPRDVSDRIAQVRARLRRAELLLAEFSTSS